MTQSLATVLSLEVCAHLSRTCVVTVADTIFGNLDDPPLLSPFHFYHFLPPSIHNRPTARHIVLRHAVRDVIERTVVQTQHIGDHLPRRLRPPEALSEVVYTPVPKLDPERQVSIVVVRLGGRVPEVRPGDGNVLPKGVLERIHFGIGHVDFVDLVFYRELGIAGVDVVGMAMLGGRGGDWHRVSPVAD